MMGGRFTKLVALGSAAVTLTGVAVLGVAGTASAAPHHGPARHERCHVVKGQWVRTWHPASRDRRGQWHHGYWTRTWVPAHQICVR
ncbi:hypothetical protein [Streptacidiphilus melanogenes]|uniref:hypothetical protein n=1 Tax=Streptacidiphilus melanogenes TaxID=411235 RepID=UPI0005A6B567|nr:hypothetical protein [Streptacidiphilus melanogenes]